MTKTSITPEVFANPSNGDNLLISLSKPNSKLRENLKPLAPLTIADQILM